MRMKTKIHPQYVDESMASKELQACVAIIDSIVELEEARGIALHHGRIGSLGLHAHAMNTKPTNLSATVPPYMPQTLSDYAVWLSPAMGPIIDQFMKGVTKDICEPEPKQLEAIAAIKSAFESGFVSGAAFIVENSELIEEYRLRSKAAFTVEIEIKPWDRDPGWFVANILVRIKGKDSRTTRNGIDKQDCLEKALFYLSTVNLNEP